MHSDCFAAFWSLIVTQHFRDVTGVSVQVTQPCRAQGYHFSSLKKIATKFNNILEGSTLTYTNTFFDQDKLNKLQKALTKAFTTAGT